MRGWSGPALGAIVIALGLADGAALAQTQLPDVNVVARRKPEPRKSQATKDRDKTRRDIPTPARDRHAPPIIPCPRDRIGAAGYATGAGRALANDARRRCCARAPVAHRRRGRPYARGGRHRGRPAGRQCLARSRPAPGAGRDAGQRGGRRFSCAQRARQRAVPHQRHRDSGRIRLRTNSGYEFRPHAFAGDRRPARAIWPTHVGHRRHRHQGRHG